MKTVTKRELNQQTAHVLAQVDAGETVVVTERGVARWRIDAIDADPDPVARLRAQGKITTPKTDPAPWPLHENATGRTPAEVDALIAEMRDE